MLRQLGADLIFMSTIMSTIMSTVMSTKKQHRKVFRCCEGSSLFCKKLPGEGSNTAQKQPQRPGSTMNSMLFEIPFRLVHLLVHLLVHF